ncbi:hypothetical protein [Bifidobacterium pseudolongum]|uniref:hypothetical protein n=1 Tax=Bifidobacterium pseudolongum TaxID=1694 RepID=UPI00101F6779|nr:hypothetical protein [Bifidobacterium pseudolongum]
MKTRQELETALRDEVNVPAGDDARIADCVERAIYYVGEAMGEGPHADRVKASPVYADCVISCAADLYESRNARFGVLNAGTSDLDPVRVSLDPLRSVWPKLKAAGVLTGSQVIV